ncbi:MAG: alpha-amylase family glycosyl hydrolase [Candidatus Izemoplasmataceae bacterium]
MEKIKLVLLSLLLVFTLTACKEEETPPVDEPDEPDMSWKIEYDMVEVSPYFEENVDVCYQIFPISYADSNGDGYGDIKGITENITYLSETLNVDCIWLNPVNPSPTYHKYDVLDYYGIDTQLGTMEDYEELLNVAEEHGIKVLMDLVVNHTSFDHPWFVNARSSKESDYRDWYIWNDLTDKEKYPSSDGWYFNNGEYYYASFWDRMPELNMDNPEVREEMKNIATFWLEKGVDGFRIDAAKHLYDLNEYPRGTNLLKENRLFFREFNDHIKSVNPDSFMVGEIWSESSSFIGYFYEGMDSTFNFPVAEAIMDGLLGGTSGEIIDTLEESMVEYGAVRDDYIDSFFLTNHDQNRILDTLSYDLDKMMLAAHINFTMPGISWIYYGEELGMTGMKPDESIRQPFKWSEDSVYNASGKTGGIANWNTRNVELDGVEEQLLNEESLLNMYIDLITLKKENSALSDGVLRLVEYDGSRLLVFIRESNDQTLLVIHNMSQVAQTFTENIGGFEVVYGLENINIVDQDTMMIDPLETLVIEISDEDVVISQE